MVTTTSIIIRVRDAPRYVPTPTEIAAECAEIRLHWTEAEARRRWRRALPASWLPPHAHVTVRPRKS